MVFESVDLPEFPDITVYIEALAERIEGATLQGIRLASPFVLRTATPEIGELTGRPVVGFERLGKRIAISLEDDFHVVIHLMIAGRLKWYSAGREIPGKLGLAAFDFDTGTVVLTEASQKKRASLHLVHGREALRAHHPGGLEVFDIDQAGFRAALSQQNRTLKRALTDQRILSGIGNAYSDEILHRARISPMRQIKYLDDDDWDRLFEASRTTLTEWTNRLRAKTAGKFPEKVTAFHPEMAVHGKYKAPCPDCGSPVQRIRYAANECNYCARCQNQGNLLADRGMSRLLKKDWPKTLEELDA